MRWKLLLFSCMLAFPPSIVLNSLHLLTIHPDLQSVPENGKIA